MTEQTQRVFVIDSQGSEVRFEPLTPKLSEFYEKLRREMEATILRNFGVPNLFERTHK